MNVLHNVIRCTQSFTNSGGHFSRAAFPTQAHFVAANSVRNADWLSPTEPPYSTSVRPNRENPRPGRRQLFSESLGRPPQQWLCWAGRLWSDLRAAVPGAPQGSPSAGARSRSSSEDVAQRTLLPSGCDGRGGAASGSPACRGRPPTKTRPPSGPLR